MNAIERIKNVIQGKAVDRVPFTFAAHMPELDLHPEPYSDALVERVNRFDLDYIRTGSNGLFAVEDLVNQLDHSPVIEGKVSVVVDTPYQAAQDLKDLPLQSIDKGAYKRELELTRLLVEKLGDRIPIQIIAFSPLTTLDKLTKNNVPSLLESGEDSLIHQALEKLTLVHKKYVEKAIEIGASGVYLASQFGRYDKLTPDQYKEFGVPYDLKVLEAADTAWFNTVHIHGPHIMFDIFREYPVHVFNWHAYETLPTLAEVYNYTGKVINAGIDRRAVEARDFNTIRNQIYHSYLDTDGGKRLILSPSCSLNHPLHEDVIDYMIQVKNETDQLFN